ncbi:MAG: hypothetical protein Q8940_07245 [Bacteroidota bacterium]|nr:hypothetical protein [Bacteroidota bacterium]
MKGNKVNISGNNYRRLKIERMFTVNFLFAIRQERDRSDKIHGNFASIHEAIAVIREEYLELETECFRRDFSPNRIEEEAIQLAAMCWKIISLAEHYDLASRIVQKERDTENETSGKK